MEGYEVGTWETEGWQDAACDAAFWRLGPETPKRMEIELSLPIAPAAATALRDDGFTKPPSCSASTNVLI